MWALAQLLLKHAWSSDLRGLLEDWADLVVDVFRQPTGLGAFRSVLSYLLGLEGTVTEDDVVRVMMPRLEAAERETMMTHVKSRADQLREEGHARGLEHGLEHGLEQELEEGRREEARDKLLRLLKSRFEVTDPVASRLDSASRVELDQWFDRALDAESLEDLFSTSD